MILDTNVKVNLGLNVLRKREDGYHDLETLFIPCHEHGDVLEVIVGDDYSRTSASLFARYGEGSVVQGISDDGSLMITIARREGVDWDPLKDLCAKAYSILASDFKLPPVKIFLEKKAPVGAGLGGGSADAAFTLKALNELCRLGLDDAALAGYAARLGSDCAFFIFNQPMMGSGRGEILEPSGLDLDALGLEMRVIVPEGLAISTAEAYKGVRPHVPEKHIGEILSLPVEQWKDLLVNDFEEPVFKAHPELAAIRQSLYDSGAVYASMSGSGSALFGLYRKTNVRFMPQLPEGGDLSRDRILLHCCCAPCSTAILEWMVSQGLRPVIFFSNSNIYPFEEYEQRRLELERYASSLGLETFDDEYDHAAWLEAVKGLENEPERGSRCSECFRFRLLRAARFAAGNGCSLLATTLASSRWKDLAQVDAAGEWAVSMVNREKEAEGCQMDARVLWWGQNWRKGGLQERRNALVRKLEMYNQNWCGCEFSQRLRSKT